MDRGAVLQHSEHAVLDQPHTVHPEKASSGFERSAEIGQLHNQKADGDPQSKGPAPLAQIEEDQGSEDERTDHDDSRHVLHVEEQRQDQENQGGQEEVVPSDIGPAASADRAYQTRRDDHQRIFPDIRKDHRSDDGVEQSTQYPAQRYAEIELRKILDRRPARGQLAVADHGYDKETSQLQEQQPNIWRRQRQYDHRDDDERLQPDHPRMRQWLPSCESEGEGQEVKRQGHDPEERRRSEVGRDMRGNAEEQT